MIWSFSKLERFIECPYSFYLHYIKKSDPQKEEGNAFSDYGTFAHSLLDGWAKG